MAGFTEEPLLKMGMVSLVVVVAVVVGIGR